MMFLIIELLFILLLAMIMLMLHLNERTSVKKSLPRAIMEEYWDGRERRKHVRFKKNLEVIYIIKNRPNSKKESQTIDISEGGMKLLLDEKLAKGLILDLIIELPDSKRTAEVECEVVWSEDVKEKDASGRRLFHSGIMFCAIKEPSGRDLINYIRSLLFDLKA